MYGKSFGIKYNKSYNPKKYSFYSKEQIASIKKHAKKRIRYFEKYLTLNNPKKILELGCGEGSLASEIKKITNATIYGIDISSTSVRQAKNKGIVAKIADLNFGIPFAARSFDVVICDQLIEHINNTDLLLKESRRVLRNNGYLIIITPNLSFWMNRILFPFGIYPVFLEASLLKKTIGQKFLKRFIVDQEAMGHVRVFNLVALVDILELQGFTIEKRIGIPQTFNLPKIYKIFYDLIDLTFSKIPSFARDIMIVARKTKT